MRFRKLDLEWMIKMLQRFLHVLLLTSLLPIVVPTFLMMFVAFAPDQSSSGLFPPWEALSYLPGGKSVWMPIWQITMLLTFLVGAVSYIRDGWDGFDW